MPRNMSFALTTEQVLKRTKTVTRRIGWKHLKPGDLFWAVKKAMGLKPGEKVERLALCRCVKNYSERLSSMWEADVAREGFPGMSQKEFVAMFCKHMRVQPSQEV